MENIILVAVDGSECGKRAVKAAAELAKNTKSNLLLTYVIDWSPYSFHTPQELEERHQRRESEINRANDIVLKPEIESLSDSGIKVSSVVRHGKIARTLVDLTTEHDASQIFIGRRGESRVRSMVFGSVTTGLIQRTLVPVTVVP